MHRLKYKQSYDTSKQKMSFPFSVLPILKSSYPCNRLKGEGTDSTEDDGEDPSGDGGDTSVGGGSSGASSRLRGLIIS